MTVNDRTFKVASLEYGVRIHAMEIYFFINQLILQDIQNVSGINLLMPNDPYSGRTAPLTSKHCILYIYSTNIDTEYFKHGIYSPFFSLQNAVYFIIITYLVPVLFTFYIQGVLKLNKNNSGARRLSVTFKGRNQFVWSHSVYSLVHERLEKI